MYVPVWISSFYVYKHVIYDISTQLFFYFKRCVDFSYISNEFHIWSIWGHDLQSMLYASKIQQIKSFEAASFWVAWDCNEGCLDTSIRGKYVENFFLSSFWGGNARKQWYKDSVVHIFFLYCKSRIFIRGRSVALKSVPIFPQSYSSAARWKTNKNAYANQK